MIDIDELEALATEGDTKTIQLRKGVFAIVDADDFHSLSRYRWYLKTNGYAYRYENMENGRRRIIQMHRQILGLTPDDKVEVDHISGFRTDNRKSNLRICTRSQNMMNRGSNSNNTSGYKGVTRQRGKWKAVICIDWRKKCLGVYDTPELAHQAYCEAAKELHGEFANFGDGSKFDLDECYAATEASTDARLAAFAFSLIAEVRRLREAEKMIVGYVSALLSKDTDTVIEITGRLTNFAFDTAEAKVKP